jgi:hypothetical protein
MASARGPARVLLPARAVHRLDHGRGLRVTVVSGTVWLTQARDARDLILSRGQSFVLDRKGRAVAYALKDAAIVVAPADQTSNATLAAPARPRPS